MGHDAARAQALVGTALPASFVTLQAVKVAAGAAGVLGAVAGLVLLLAPRRYFAEGAALRRWLLEADVGKLLDKRHSIERRLYRWHRLTGAAVLVGAGAAFALLIFLALDPRSIPLRLALGRLGFRTLLGVAGAVALLLVVFSLCMLIRPSVLKNVEALANRWFEQKASPLHLRLSRAIARAPRVAGALLIAAALVCVWPF